MCYFSSEKAPNFSGVFMPILCPRAAISKTRPISASKDFKKFTEKKFQIHFFKYILQLRKNIGENLIHASLTLYGKAAHGAGGPRGGVFGKSQDPRLPQGLVLSILFVHMVAVSVGVSVEGFKRVRLRHWLPSSSFLFGNYVHKKVK